MSLKNIQPAESYDLLKIQFFALKRLLQSKEAEVKRYRERVNEFSFARIIELEAQLASEKEMNSMLSEELETKYQVK